jgi:hypothetical protein
MLNNTFGGAEEATGVTGESTCLILSSTTGMRSRRDLLLKDQ